MQTFKELMALRVQQLMMRQEARWAILLSSALVAVGFIETCMKFNGHFLGEVPSAFFAWCANVDNMQIQALRVFFFYLIFLLASMAYSDAYYLERKNEIASKLITRGGRAAYFCSLACVTFLGGFIVVFVPLMVAQLLAFVAFPVIVNHNAFQGVINSPAFDPCWLQLAEENALFPSLYFEAPLANNLIQATYAAIWGGVAALLSLLTSFFCKKSRLLVLGLPTLLYMISFFVLPASFSLPYYLYPCIFVDGLSVSYFIFAPLALILVVAVGIALACWRKVMP